MADKIRPACLPLKRSMDQDLSGRYMVAAGWGKQSDGKYFTPPRPSEIRVKNWSTKVKPFLTSHFSQIMAALAVLVSG